MKKSLKKLKRSKKWARILYFLIIFAYIISFAFFAKNIIALTGIETIVRYTLLLLLVGFLLIYIFINYGKLIQKKYFHLIFSSFISLVLILLFILCSIFVDSFYNRLKMLYEKDSIIYTSYLVTMKDDSINAKSTLGMINDKEDIEGYILAQQIIDDHSLKNDIKYYDSYTEMLDDLYGGDINGIFLSSNYVTLYSGDNKYSNISTETKKVYQASKKMDNEDLSLSSDKSLSEPFSVLVLGVDSEYDGLDANAAFNGDTLILATFNPDTFTATLLSIPRDTFVPISCRNNVEAKINSSAAYGTSCVIDTIEQLTDVEIDYYVKINFKGVVDLVEAVGGIELEIEEPYTYINDVFDCKGKFCEQDSNRRWGEYTIYIDPGYRKINGEQALAYSRNRHQYASGDVDRNKHQQEVIMALAKKMLTVRNYGQFKNILDAVSKNISTNMSTNKILSSYKIFKEMIKNVIKDQDFINIQKLQLEIYDLNLILESGNKYSALGYYPDSLEAIKKAMNINLEKESVELIKTFSYSLNENYEQEIPGKGLRGGQVHKVLTSFIGQTKNQADSYCKENNIDCTFIFVDDTSKKYNKDVEKDLIGAQDIPSGTLLKEVDKITIYINGASMENDTKEID